MDDHRIWPPRLTPGLVAGSSVRWTGVGPGGAVVGVNAGRSVLFSPDGGVSLEVVALGAARDAWLAPSGEVIVWGAGGAGARTGRYARVDSAWRHLGPVAALPAAFEGVVAFAPDRSLLVHLDSDRDAATPALARLVPTDDGYRAEGLEIDAGAGVTLLSIEEAQRVGDALRVVANGFGPDGTARRRLLCELGADATPRPLSEPGLPPDLGPGELAILALRREASGSWDRMAFDTNGRVWVAADRALWGGGGAQPFFQGSRKESADWRPNAETADLPEVSGVAVLPDGQLAFGLNFFVGRTARRVLFIDPGTREVSGWKEFQPFDDGVGGYSEGDIFNLRVFGGHVFGMTGLGTATIDAPREVGPGERRRGLPGLGAGRDEDGAWFFVRSRHPVGGVQYIERGSFRTGEIPRGECDACVAYPGLIQAFAVDTADRVFVLDRMRGEVWMRPFDGDDEDWALIARGFHNPADLAIRQDAGGPLVVVLDGEVWAFRPDPNAVAVRGRRVRAGSGEVAPALAGAAQTDAECAPGNPCITPPTYPGRPEDIQALDGFLLLEPSAEGRFCLAGQGFGAEPGTVWVGDETVAEVTHWIDGQICARVGLDGLVDGVVTVETAGGARSNALPYLAAARNIRFRLRGDRPMQVGDTFSLKGDNLGVRGHRLFRAVALGVDGGLLHALLEAADGRLTGFGAAGGRLRVAMAGGDETWLVGGPKEADGAWEALGSLPGSWEAHPVGDALVLIQTGEDGAAPALRRATLVPDEGGVGGIALVLGRPLDMQWNGVAAGRIMAWLAEPGGALILAVRMADGAERIATLPAGADSLTWLAVLPAEWSGIGATYDADGQAARYGVADVIREGDDLFVALAGGGGRAERGLWIGRVEDGARTQEMASVEVDKVRCLGPWPESPGACGTPGSIDTNTSGCTLFACPKVERLWLPQEGGEVEHARLAWSDEGLEVTYAVRFPEGWSRDELDRGRIRTAVFRLPPFSD